MTASLWSAATLFALFSSIYPFVGAAPTPSPTALASAKAFANPSPFGPQDGGRDFVYGIGAMISIAANKNYMRSSPQWKDCMEARKAWTNSKRRLIKREALPVAGRGGGGRSSGGARSGGSSKGRKGKDGKDKYAGAELSRGLPTKDKNGKKYLCI